MNGRDDYMPIREYCTCPGCRMVWSHLETGHVRADAKWATERYYRAYTCENCGLTSEQIPNLTMWLRMRNTYRRIVEPQPEKQMQHEQGRER